MLGSALPTIAQTVEHITSAITADTTWDSDTNDDGLLDKIYLIDFAISVKAAGLGTTWNEGDGKVTLTIEPGTVIAGTGTGIGETAVVGSLVVTRAGRLDAQGTVNNPIVFTSVLEAESRYGIDIDGDEYVNDLALSPATDGGEWGGVILLGTAPINFVSGGVNVGERSIEGFPAGASADILYGGSSPNDDSGILRYVRIEFGGYEFAPNEEINGLTLGGVGCGTTVEYVEVVGNTDDGFEFFGGTLNTKHLVSFFNQDESFDLDQGHSGTHQFWFALQSRNSDNGSEADGGDGDTKTLLPLTNTKIYNATYIGGGAASNNGTANDGFRLKDNFAGQFHNSIFHDFGGNSIRIDDASTAAQVGVNLNFTNNVWGSFAAAGTQGQTAAADALLAQSGNTAVGTNPGFISLQRSSAGEIVSVDPRPVAGGAAWGTVTDGGLCTANYRGAFGSENWTQTWTYASCNGYVASCWIPDHSITVEHVTSAITANTTWDSDTNDDGRVDKIYLIDSAISVKAAGLGTSWNPGDAKVTLTIEPGTVIAGTGTGIGETAVVGSLVVTRAGRLDAQGTVTNPIIFTSVLEAESRYGIDIDGDEYVNDLALSPATDGGEWGGVILLGTAPINFASGGVNVGERSIEGFRAGASADILYGGSSPTDDSGILRYVRIEFGGYEFAPNEEINGLTLGGVGSGTTVEYVEVVGNTDDGFEFFGGTLSTRHLVSFFNQDESFDLDQGHSGTHQFWFAVQSQNSDNGSEADGGDGDTKTLLPLTDTKIYNATYIGGGALSNGGSANDGFRLKDNFAGQFHNSIFHDFGGNSVRIDDASTAAQVGAGLCFTNNIWGSFATAGTQGQTAAADALLAQLGNTAVGTDPALSAYWRTVAGEMVALDPRPSEASVAWGNSLLQGAPTQVAYRGAFGDSDWTRTWTYMSNYGYIEPCFGQFEIPAATFVVKGGGGLKITGVSLSGVNMTISFDAEVGKTYQVKHSVNIQSGFGEVGGASKTATSTAEAITFAVPGGPVGLFLIEEQP